MIVCQVVAVGAETLAIVQLFDVLARPCALLHPLLDLQVAVVDAWVVIAGWYA